MIGAPRGWRSCRPPRRRVGLHRTCVPEYCACALASYRYRGEWVFYATLRRNATGVPLLRNTLFDPRAKSSGFRPIGALIHGERSSDDQQHLLINIMVVALANNEFAQSLKRVRAPRTREPPVLRWRQLKKGHNGSVPSAPCCRRRSSFVKADSTAAAATQHSGNTIFPDPAKAVNRGHRGYWMPRISKALPTCPCSTATRG